MSLAAIERFITPSEPKNAEALKFNSGFNDPSTLRVYQELLEKVPEMIGQNFKPEETGFLVGKVSGDIRRAMGLRGVHHLGYGVYGLLALAGVANPKTDHIREYGSASGLQWDVANWRPTSGELIDLDPHLIRFANALNEQRSSKAFTTHLGDTGYKPAKDADGVLFVMTAQYLTRGAKDFYQAFQRAKWASSTDLVHTASPIHDLALENGHLKEGVVIPVDPDMNTGFAYMVNGKGEQLTKNMEVYNDVAIVYDQEIYNGNKLAVKSLPDVSHTSPMVLYTHQNGEKVFLPWYPKPKIDTDEAIQSSAKATGLMELMFRLQGFDARHNVRIAVPVMKNHDLSAVVISCAGGEGGVTNGALAGVFSRYFNEALLTDLDNQGALDELKGEGRLFKSKNDILDLVKNPGSWVPLSTLQSPPFHNITVFKDNSQFRKFRDFLS